MLENTLTRVWTRYPVVPLCHSTVDLDDLATDPFGIRRTEQCYDISGVLRTTETAEWVHRSITIDLVVSFVRAEQFRIRGRVQQR